MALLYPWYPNPNWAPYKRTLPRPTTAGLPIKSSLTLKMHWNLRLKQSCHKPELKNAISILIKLCGRWCSKLDWLLHSRITTDWRQFSARWWPLDLCLWLWSELISTSNTHQAHPEKPPRLAGLEPPSHWQCGMYSTGYSMTLLHFCCIYLTIVYADVQIKLIIIRSCLSGYIEDLCSFPVDRSHWLEIVKTWESTVITVTQTK